MKTDISVSELTEWIGLFTPDLAADGQGGFIETTPTTVAEDRPAKVQMITGRRTLNNEQEADRAEFYITIRYEPGITTAFRLSWRSSFLDIVLVDNVESLDMFLKLTCVRREAGKQ